MFLMPEHFEVVAGEAVVERIRAARAQCTDLCAQQVAESRAHIRGAEIVRTNYGFSVRYDSGLQNFELLASARRRQVDGSYASAVAFARQWVEQDPQNRYAWVRLPY